MSVCNVGGGGGGRLHRKKVSLLAFLKLCRCFNAITRGGPFAGMIRMLI